MAETSAATEPTETAPGVRPAKASGGVQSVDRAIELLELLADFGGESGLSELAQHAGLPLPTIHRLLRTLLAQGYVRQTPSRRYTLGPRLIRLGESAGRQLGAGARPYLERLAHDLGESANLAMIDRDMAVYVAQASSSHSMRMFTEVGRRVYTHCTGVGKAVLAQLPDQTVREIMGRVGMPPATDQSITDVDALLADPTTDAETAAALRAGQPLVVGYEMAGRYDEDFPVRGYTFGYTEILGVRSAYRGRRVAVAALAAGMRAFAADGMQYAALDVDTENPSGAHGLYASLGYEKVTGSRMYSIEL